MTRQLRIRTKYRKPLDEDQLALAFLLLAKQVREEVEEGETKKSRRNPKRRAA